jgi:hypothetical protein
MLRDFGRFLQALWTEWSILLTGGSIVAVLVLWTTITAKPIPQSANWTVGGVTLVLASFRAWRKEWIEGGSGFTEVNIEWLVQQFQNRTTMQAEILIRPYLGKWAKVTGELQDIRHIYWYSLIAFKIPPGIFATVWVWRWTASKLSSLPRGTLITVAGRISRVRAGEISLSGGEFLCVAQNQQETRKLSST